MVWAVVAVIAVAVGFVATSHWQSRRRHDAAYVLAIRAWKDSPADAVEPALTALLAGTSVNAPAAYLLGCLKLRHGRMKDAARAFGMAHHADCNLETAALLTFAALKAGEGQASDIVIQIVETWIEMKQPTLFQTTEDRQMLDCLQTGQRPGPRLSPLGKLAWCVVGDHQQSMIETIAERPESAALPLFK